MTERRITTAEPRQQGAAAADHAAPGPGLAGWLQRAVLALWVSTLLLAIAAPFAGRILLPDVSGPWGGNLNRIGLFDVSGMIVPYSAEAKGSGFARGDTVIAVDGRSISDAQIGSLDAAADALLAGADGTTIRLTARSPDGTVKEHRLTRSEARVDEFFAGSGITRPMADLFLTLNMFVNSAVSIAAAALLFLRGRRQRVALILSFAFLSSALATAVPFWIALDLWSVRWLTNFLSWFLLIFAVMVFPDGHFAQRPMRWVALLFAVNMILVAVAVTEALHPLVRTTVLSAIPLFLVAAVVSLVMRYRNLPAGTERQQIRWALFGFAAAAPLLIPIPFLEEGLMAQAETPSVWLWSFLLDNLLFILLRVVITGGLAISLLRYRLYDADRVIARSASFGALALVLVAMFAGIERVIELLGEEYFHEEIGVLAGGIGAGVAALMIVPLHHRLTHWAERKFQKDLIQLRHGLPALVGDLRETAPADRIAAASLDWIVRGVHASRAALVMGSGVIGARGIEVEEVESWRMGWIPAVEPGLEAVRDDKLFPLRIPLEADGHGRVGWLFLGPRPDGSFYGKDEREVLAEIADPVARALEIAQRREARETAELERWREQEGLNAELKAVNGEMVRILGALNEKLGQLLPAK